MNIGPNIDGPAPCKACLLLAWGFFVWYDYGQTDRRKKDMIVKLVNRETGVATHYPIDDKHCIESGMGICKYDEGHGVKIMRNESVIAVPDMVISEIKEDAWLKFFAIIKDDRGMIEVGEGMEVEGTIEKCVAFSSNEYECYILENGKTVDRI